MASTRKKGGGLQVDPALLRIGVLGDRWTHSRARVGVFGTAHNSLFAKHLFPKQLHPMKLFFFPSHKDMSWDEAEKK